MVRCYCVFNMIECPPVCAIFCEYGHKVGPDGCAECECNSSPFGCDVSK